METYKWSGKTKMLQSWVFIYNFFFAAVRFLNNLCVSMLIIHILCITANVMNSAFLPIIHNINIS